MHMEKGIGRTGYILLASVVFAIGVFGFLLSWTAFQAEAYQFFGMGLAVAGVGLLGLFLFAVFAPLYDAPRGDKPAAKRPAAPEPPVKADAAKQEFEFDDYQPAAKAAPEEVVIPPAFKEETPPMPNAAPVEFTTVSKAEAEKPPVAVAAAPATPAARDPANWPGKRGTSTWTKQQERAQAIKQEVDHSARRREMADRYTANTPQMRAIMEPAVPKEPQADEAPAVPEKLADRAPVDMNTDFVAPGMSVGQCGQCKTLLLAPEERPLRLKCPDCAKVTLLK